MYFWNVIKWSNSYTLLGTDVTVTIDTIGVYIDGALVTVADIIGDNGVVHVIDAILLPNLVVLIQML